MVTIQIPLPKCYAFRRCGVSIDFSLNVGITERELLMINYKKLRFMLLGILLFLFMLNPMEVHAEGNTTRSVEQTVRVGWYQTDMFQEGAADDQIKSGYCYDYLQKIADYTSWHYEYVPGDWEELFQMLQKGEIDFLGGVFMKEKRKKTLLFPESAMGTEQYYLYKKSDDSSISTTDISTLSGKKVGGIVDDCMTNVTEQWIKDNNIDLEMVYFKSFEEQEKAFESGEIDLLTQTTSNVLLLHGISIVVKVGEEPFYLAVNKKREDLLCELNSSINTILSIDPFILQHMQYANYSATLISKTMTEEEKEWANSHNKMVVGYLDNYLPYSDKDANGKVTGLMTDVLDAIVKSLKLEKKLCIEYKAFPNYDAMMSDLRNNQIDVAFPVHGDLWQLEQDGIDATAGVVTGSETFFYKGSYKKNQVKTIAVNKNNKMQIVYCKKNFPDAVLEEYSSIEDCLLAVLDNKADGTVVNILRTELVTGNSKYKGLSYVQLEKDARRCFGVKEDNAALLLLLNRGLRAIDSSFGIDNSYKYMDGFHTYGTMEFIRDNILWIGLILVTIAGIIIFLLILNLRRKERVVREKEEYVEQVKAFNVELEELKREADAANAAKTSFLFNMSHDIRTPMNAILGFAKLMESEVEQPEKLKEYLGKIQTSGEFLLSLINNMLEVARIDSGKESVDEGYVDLMDESCSVAPLLESEISRKKLIFTQSMNIQHRYVYADIQKIKEIAMNLLSNAIKYTPEGGSIHMQFDEIPCDREGYATFSNTITDTGIGMNAEFMNQIFDSFSRERNTTESKIAGTGLGMSIVKKTVELMGGTIEVESELGKGSSFKVTLSHRIVENPEKYFAKQKVMSDKEVNLDGKRILLAEDNELNAEIAIEILGTLGIQAEHAKDGVECVDMLVNKENGYYDIILMDIQMPNLNGYDATKRIRALAETEKANIPIVAMTANAFDEDKRNALNAGMNGHLAKPIEIPKLVEMLNEILE